jgi:hypothetical protein
MTPEVTSNKIAELKVLRSQLNRWRTGIPVVVLVIMFTSMFKIYSVGRNLSVPGPGRDEFVASVQQGLKQDVQPIVELIAKQTYLETKNAVQVELKKINTRTPEFAAALKTQIEELVRNIPERTEKVIAKTFAEALARQELAVREMFPEVDEKRVAAVVLKLTEAAEVQCEFVGEKMFEPHLISINNMIGDLQTISKSEDIEGAASLASWEMALIVFDLLRDEFDEVPAAPVAKAIAADDSNI